MGIFFVALLLCTEDDNSCYRNVCKMSVVSFALNPFLGVTSKKGFMCFSANVGHHFLKSNNVGRHFCPDFQGFSPDFNKSKHLGCVLTPSNPASYTTAPGKSTVGPYLKKSFRRPCLGYMLIYRNAEGVHGQRKFGSPCFKCLGYSAHSLALFRFVANNIDYILCETNNSSMKTCSAKHMTTILATALSHDSYITCFRANVMLQQRVARVIVLQSASACRWSSQAVGITGVGGTYLRIQGVVPTGCSVQTWNSCNSRCLIFCLLIIWNVGEI